MRLAHNRRLSIVICIRECSAKAHNCVLMQHELRLLDLHTSSDIREAQQRGCRLKRLADEVRLSDIRES